MPCKISEILILIWLRFLGTLLRDESKLINKIMKGWKNNRVFRNTERKEKKKFKNGDLWLRDVENFLGVAEIRN